MHIYSGANVSHPLIIYKQNGRMERYANQMSIWTRELSVVKEPKSCWLSNVCRRLSSAFFHYEIHDSLRNTLTTLSIYLMFSDLHSFEILADIPSISLSRHKKDLQLHKVFSTRYTCWHSFYTTLQWRHNETECVSNHQPHVCELNGLFKAQIKQNIKAPRHWPLSEEFTGDRWIPRTNGQ